MKQGNAVEASQAKYVRTQIREIIRTMVNFHWTKTAKGFVDSSRVFTSTIQASMNSMPGWMANDIQEWVAKMREVPISPNLVKTDFAVYADKKIATLLSFAPEWVSEDWITDSLPEEGLGKKIEKPVMMDLTTLIVERAKKALSKYVFIRDAHLLNDDRDFVTVINDLAGGDTFFTRDIRDRMHERYGEPDEYLVEADRFWIWVIEISGAQFAVVASSPGADVQNLVLTEHDEASYPRIAAALVGSLKLANVTGLAFLNPDDELGFTSDEEDAKLDKRQGAFVDMIIAELRHNPQTIYAASYIESHGLCTAHDPHPMLTVSQWDDWNENGIECAMHTVWSKPKAETLIFSMQKEEQEEKPEFQEGGLSIGSPDGSDRSYLESPETEPVPLGRNEQAVHFDDHAKFNSEFTFCAGANSRPGERRRFARWVKALLAETGHVGWEFGRSNLVGMGFDKDEPCLTIGGWAEFHDEGLRVSGVSSNMVVIELALPDIEEEKCGPSQDEEAQKYERMRQRQQEYLGFFMQMNESITGYVQHFNWWNTGMTAEDMLGEFMTSIAKIYAPYVWVSIARRDMSEWLEKLEVVMEEARFGEVGREKIIELTKRTFPSWLSTIIKAEENENNAELIENILTEYTSKLTRLAENFRKTMDEHFDDLRGSLDRIRRS